MSGTSLPRKPGSLHREKSGRFPRVRNESWRSGISSRNVSGVFLLRSHPSRPAPDVRVALSSLTNSARISPDSYLDRVRGIRVWLPANGRERAAMDCANSIFCDRGQVSGGAVAFVLGESVIRIPAIVLEHET